MSSIACDGVKWWNPNWVTFRQNHTAWLARHERSTEVLYRLPEQMRQKLAFLRHGRPILEPADVAAEKDFNALCLEFHSEAVYQALPVRYTHFQPPVVLPSANQLKEMGLAFDQTKMKEAAAKADDLQLRNKGYVGRLLTDLPFLQARDDLRDVWLALPEWERPGFPLARTTIPLALSTPSVADFQVRLDEFCDRYGLQAMATWELPDPVGPLLGGGPWPSHILKCRQVVIALPSHFPIMDKDELLEMIRSQQQAHIREAGLDPTCIGPRSMETYARLLEIDHYERVVIGRYGRRPRPKGFVTQLNEAIMDQLDIGPDHLRTLRKALAAFKRGAPHTGKWTH